jgi:hypothetical protein
MKGVNVWEEPSRQERDRRERKAEGKNDRREDYDSQTSSSSSDALPRWICSRNAEGAERDREEVADILAQVFPENPEMTKLAWEDEQGTSP